MSCVELAAAWHACIDEQPDPEGALLELSDTQSTTVQSDDNPPDNPAPRPDHRPTP